ncbi:MAG TPA: glycosyltransferase family 2 protein [Candidatus Omnitrophota bacterium]|nr:glycosyltransferase family 2 protein [Candidatus Omnitrophota bacterium]
MRISLVIPAFNEESRIGATLEEIGRFFSGKDWQSELIVVDDGSPDRTCGVVETAWKNFPGEKKLLKNGVNSGKGYSVRRGMLEAKGDYVFFSDADLSTPIGEIEKLLAAFGEGFDVAIGSRDLPGSDVQVHQNFMRELMGRIFNRIARFLTFKGVHDSQCGFKGFRREAAQALFSRQKMAGFSFDAEIIYLAQRLGFRVREVPVIWRNSPKSRVSVWKDPVFMLLDLLRIRYYHRHCGKA